MPPTSFPTIEVNLPLASGSDKDAWVKIDGVKLPGVRAIACKAGINELTEVTLELIGHLKGQVEAVLVIRDETIDAQDKIIAELERELSQERARARAAKSKRRWWHAALWT